MEVGLRWSVETCTSIIKSVAKHFPDRGSGFEEYRIKKGFSVHRWDNSRPLRCVGS